MTSANYWDGRRPLARSIPVRFFILLLAACSSAEAIAPAATSHLPSRCPVGDQTHVDVYGFLEEALRAAGGDRATTKQQLAYEVELLRARDMKPQRAGIVEGETSHVITTLCAGTPGCKAIGLYDRGGFALALSTHRDIVMPLGFGDDARWRQLSTAAAGSLFPLIAADGADRGTTGTLVAFPVDGALAACIVEPI